MTASDVTPLTILFLILGTITLGLALYRWFVAKDEKDVILLAEGEQREVSQQVAVASRLASIDRWGKIMTVVTLALGLCVGATYLYIAWHDPSEVPNTFYRR